MERITPKLFTASFLAVVALLLNFESTAQGMFKDERHPMITNFADLRMGFNGAKNKYEPSAQSAPYIKDRSRDAFSNLILQGEVAGSILERTVVPKHHRTKILDYIGLNSAIALNMADPQAKQLFHSFGFNVGIQVAMAAAKSDFDFSMRYFYRFHRSNLFFEPSGTHMIGFGLRYHKLWLQTDLPLLQQISMKDQVSINGWNYANATFRFMFDNHRYLGFRYEGNNLDGVFKAKEGTYAQKSDNMYLQVVFGKYFVK